MHTHSPLFRALSSQGVVCPVAAAAGALGAQEVVKAVTGKHTPINQWLYLDAAEAAPSPLPSAAECAPRGNRCARPPKLM